MDPTRDSVAHVKGPSKGQASKGPSQGQTQPPRDPRRSRTTAAGPGRQGHAGPPAPRATTRDVEFDSASRADRAATDRPRSAAHPAPAVRHAPAAPTPPAARPASSRAAAHDYVLPAARTPAPRPAAAAAAPAARQPSFRSMPSLEDLDQEYMDDLPPQPDFEVPTAPRTRILSPEEKADLERTYQRLGITEKWLCENTAICYENFSKNLPATSLQTDRSEQAPSPRPVRRPRLPSEEEANPDLEEEAKRLKVDGKPFPHRDSRPTSCPPPATQIAPADRDDTLPTYADRVRSTPSPQPSRTPQPPQPASAAPSGGPGPQNPRGKLRYPPFIVESLPNWAFHFRELKKILGRAPSARPFGKGVKFTPQEDHEFRVIQRYLTALERSENISWFSYSLPATRSLKIAIRGLPVDTDPADIDQDLREQGFEPEYIRPIRARKGRPGCIFLAFMKRTANLTPGIYEVREILCMPGVTIEAWRGKKGPAQCHRCQKFRHSSHNCHRQLACVRCGEQHTAHECPRPLEEPATCANCGGPHPANHTACPAFRKEARNKRAGTVAETRAQPRKQAPPSELPPRNEQGATIRTPANEAREKGAPFRKRKPRKRKPKKTAPTTGPAEPGPKPANGILQVAIGILKDVLEALLEGRDAVPIVLGGLQNLVSPASL